MQINFKVIDDVLVMSDTLQKFVSGNTNTYICKFNITTTLQDKFIWYAVFYTNDGSVYRREIKDGKCYIPEGAIRVNRGFSLRIGVYATVIGTEDVKRLSTNLLTINIVPGAYCEDAVSSVPSHDTWEEMLSRSIPIIGDNGNWFIYDFEKGDYVDSGKSSKGDAVGQLNGEKSEIFNDYENNKIYGIYSHAENTTGVVGLEDAESKIISSHFENESGVCIYDMPTGSIIKDGEDAILTVPGNVDYFSAATQNDIFIININEKVKVCGLLKSHEESAESNIYILTNLCLSHGVDLSTVQTGNVLVLHYESIEDVKSVGYTILNEYQGLTKNSVQASHAEGSSIISGSYQHGEGFRTKAYGKGSHTEGKDNISFGDYSHSEGNANIAVGLSSHAEGSETQAIGSWSHTEGKVTYAGAPFSHAEGSKTKTLKYSAHAEGDQTIASGVASHAEGQTTTASADHAHSEGQYTIASGFNSHAENTATEAAGISSHAEGNGTKATGTNQHVQGKFNKIDASKAFIIGNGSSDTERSNALTVDWNGRAEFSGDVVAKNMYSNGKKVAVSEEVETALNKYVGTGLYAFQCNLDSTASGYNSFASGSSTKALGIHAHTEGEQTITTGQSAHSEGYMSYAIGHKSHTEGYNSISFGLYSHAEGSFSMTGSFPYAVMYKTDEGVYHLKSVDGLKEGGVHTLL